MKNVIVFIFAIALAACSNNPENNQTHTSEADVVVDAPAINVYGDSISEEGAMDPADFLAEMEGKDSLDAKVKAVITETCANKGCWMKLDMGNGKEMRVQFKDYGFFVPKEGMEGKHAVIEGKAYTDTVSIETLRHFAKDAGKSDEEIAAINAPKVETSFEAKGVLIEK